MEGLLIFVTPLPAFLPEYAQNKRR